MLQAAVRLISTQGSTGTGLREIVAASDARGSLQHSFPGGQDHLVTKTITITGEVAARRVLRLAGLSPVCDQSGNPSPTHTPVQLFDRLVRSDPSGRICCAAHVSAANIRSAIVASDWIRHGA